jgi:hypothetical protein
MFNLLTPQILATFILSIAPLHFWQMPFSALKQGDNE